MMSRSSKGKWYVNLDMKEQVLCSCKEYPYSTIVAECPGYKEEREANAKIIATTPMLIIALKQLVVLGRKSYPKDASGAGQSELAEAEAILNEVGEGKGY